MAMLGNVTPILRIFDEAKAREFYIDFLGFRVLFEHRFGEDFPLYVGIARDAAVLHLTEHYGDGAPGASIRIEADDVAALQRDLLAKQFRFARPGPPEQMPWGTLELKINDPFFNRIVFWQAAAQ